MPVLVTLLRAIHVASMLSALGTTAFVVWLLPAGRNQALDDALRRLGRFSGLVSALTGGGWLMLEAGVIAGADSFGDLLAALPEVVTDTRFGQLVTIRLLLLIAGSVLIGTRRPRAWAALALFAVASLVEGLLGHAGAAAGLAGQMLVISEAMHMLAAGVWLGSLAPLWIAVRRLPVTEAAAICERFSPIGLGCVLLLAGTGLAQGLALIGGLPALLGTQYGHIALIKIGLFVVALGLAALNRLWLTDRLAVSDRPTIVAKRVLLASVAVETAIGLAVIAAAAVLASSVPGIHEPPVWPLPWRFSVATVREDPDFRNEVIVSASLICASFLSIWVAFLFRRLRFVAIALFVIILAWRGSSMTLLTAEAYPTSFQTSPTEFGAASIVRGGALFTQHCASCHGVGGAGNGPRAAGLRIKPDDLTQPHIWEHADGDMFWWIGHGIDDPEGGTAMPGFSAVLSPEDRWALIDYVHALAAGAGAHQSAAYEMPVRAPAMGVACDGGSASSMADLAGRFVLVVTRPEDAVSAPSDGETRIVRLLLSTNEQAEAERGTCVAQDQAAWNAFAILAGIAPDQMAGAMFLVDPGGWLRAERLPADAAWRSADGLRAATTTISRTKIEDSNGDLHEHHH